MTLNTVTLVAIAGITVALVLAWVTSRMGRRLAEADRERRHLADELNQRLSELFSLQELSYVLSGSLQLDRIVDQVVRYAMRFLDARGALVALALEDPAGPLHVVAAEGTLGDLLHAAVSRDDPGLLARSATRDRLELAPASNGAPVAIAAGLEAGSAAAVPLRAHGVVVGTMVIADPRAGGFETEHIRLLSTVATHAAVVLANARFFAMVERAKEQWETAFDALREGIAVVDAGGRVQRANRSLAAFLGRAVPEVAGEPLCQALFDRPQAMMDLLDQARGGNGPPPLVARSDRLGRTVRITAASIPSTTSERSVVVLVEDVTDQQTLETQLIQSEKLAAVGQLVSGVAHELNNPLTSIAGLSEFLLEQKELGPKDKGHLQVIHEQAERASRIVRNLLTFARKGPAEEAHVDVGDVIRQTLLLMSYDLKLKDIAIEVDLAPRLPGVLGDRHAVQQVMLNLLTNAAQAVDAAPPGGPRRVHVRAWFDNLVHVRVTDTGPGIPDDIVPHIFTPFFTTKEPGHGTGLGLSITYSIIEAHGGHIAHERPPEGGAAFRIDLPAAAPGAARRRTVAEDAAPLPLPPAVKRSILLVDDDPAVGLLVNALFGREGHTVEVARSAKHALELAGTGDWDLVIADGRATTQGRLLVEELLERHPSLRARTLVATGDVRPATEEAVNRLGLRYLRKPFNLRLLRDEAARVWAAAAPS